MTTQPQPLATTATSPERTADSGLTSEEIEARVLRGDVNVVPATTSRAGVSILASNIVTRFNLLLGLLLAAILAIGPIQDALFGFALFVHTPIGSGQALCSKT